MHNEMICCLIALVPLSIVVYNILPMIYVNVFYREMTWLNKPDAIKTIDRIIKTFPFGNKIRQKILSKIEESGIGDDNTWIFWCFLTLILPLIIFFLMIFSGRGVVISIVTAAVCFILPEIWLKQRTENRRKAFVKNSYKIYSFLHTQISAGIKPTDAIKGIYEIADHPLIQSTFVKFTAKYELTIDIETALKTISDSYRGHDGEMLCVCIKQCVDTGMAGKTLMKMEEMMFAKYFNIIQSETEKYRTKLLIAGLSGLVPLLILLCMPMIYEAMSGFMSMLNG